ncbi:G-type lectin S-receptor-like serine/threonine-protein kinase SD1-1 [Jatropha curcas]|uniref:G-type lectin S-receptor-like serine/threonine-protein kinase SD1-1 n=1 Tax=Jatropha curcas TaxID=180498 RepID=UPI001892FBBD|nr:G-type lectin S-receptor-like serine/threonine-protein kinase SD1-1 [Jatropha curcas]
MKMLLASYFFFLLFLRQPSSSSLGTINPGQSIKDGKTLVSAGGKFELGFFEPENSKKRYLGIWYKDPSAYAVIWVANRETPLIDRSGVLLISNQSLLIILNSKNIARNQHSLVDLTEQANVPRIQGFDSPCGITNLLWQSFDSPCDTLLPGMKIGRNFLTGQETFLTSWKSEDNPGHGQFSFWIDPAGFPQLVVRNGTSKHYRLGSWNGVRFTGTPLLPSYVDFLTYEFELNKNGVYYSYKVEGTLLSRLLMNRSGFLEKFVRINHPWIHICFEPLHECDTYSVCGANMKCNIIDNSHTCDCLEGFILESSKNRSNHCVRKTPLDCKKGSVFHKYIGLKLPDTSDSWYDMNMTLAECKEECSKNCSCTAYANSNIIGEGSGCVLWFGELIDMRYYTEGGQDIYIRMSSSKPADQYKKELIGIIVSSAILIGMLVVGIIGCIRKKKQRKREKVKGSYIECYEDGEVKEDMELPIFDLPTIAKATDNFSSINKLGQGGFGPVYKGTLTNGQEIAVKRLSKSSGQGLTEFKNEVILIAKLQHRNLVKLLGCCIEKDEKMLIYEFMPNKSLDFFIFDQMRSNFLDWKKRFHIIEGVARGLVYLHQDSRLRIIHRDLKASNVLLDKDMNPKISDFGLARIFGGDQTEANTNRVAGTYGYMSPEYAVDGLFSMKSDVFSFGVLILEIVSGKKNRGFFHQEHNHNLLGHAWKLWIEERSMELVDRKLRKLESLSMSEKC